MSIIFPNPDTDVAQIGHQTKHYKIFFFFFYAFKHCSYTSRQIWSPGRYYNLRKLIVPFKFSCISCRNLCETAGLWLKLCSFFFFKKKKNLAVSSMADIRKVPAALAQLCPVVLFCGDPSALYYIEDHR